MPQMSPMMWETMFIMFLVLYMMINAILYWQMNKNKKMKNIKMNMNYLNWKW